MKQPKRKEATSASGIKKLSYFMSQMDKLTNTPAEIDNYVEVLGKQLYFAVVKGKCSLKLKNTSDALFFCTDEELVYDNYYADFGPLNISCLFKFCCRVRKLLSFSRGMKSVVYYTCSQLEMKTNAACLMGCFSVIYLGFHPYEIWKILQQLSPYKPYIDASQISCGFHLCILDVLQAVHKAVQFNFFNFNDFNVSEYDLYDRLQYGDINWLLPRKFLAFIGPSDTNQAHPPEYYLKYFLKNDVKSVVRLNQACYDANVFRNAGIQHYDLIFPDGTTPPREILLHFLTIAEMGPGAVAVHCKAGLGRTGSLIGAYLIKHYHMTAREAIGWMRLCRPGSVIGHQQIWMEKIESWLWTTGNQHRLQKFGSSDKIPRHRYGIYSKQWPLDRERILAEARKKIQLNRLRLDFGKTSPQGAFAQMRQKRQSTSAGFVQSKQTAKIGAPTMRASFKALFDDTRDANALCYESLHQNDTTHTGANNQSIFGLPASNILKQNTQGYTRTARSHHATSSMLVPAQGIEPHKRAWGTQGDKLNEIKVARQMTNTPPRRK